MAAQVRLLRTSDRIATPWKNGGGVTREVCRDSHSAPGGDFDWRVSIAEVAQPGPFSKFSGYSRLIALIEGQGMELSSASGESVPLLPRTVHAFDGEAEVTGTLPFGPVSDLNVIYRPDAFDASLRFSERAERLDARRGNVSILINVQRIAVDCVADSQSLALEYLDAVLITGASLSRAAGSSCAVIELRAPAA